MRLARNIELDGLIRHLDVAGDNPQGLLPRPRGLEIGVVLIQLKPPAGHAEAVAARAVAVISGGAIVLDQGGNIFGGGIGGQRGKQALAMLGQDLVELFELVGRERCLGGEGTGDGLARAG